MECAAFTPAHELKACSPNPARWCTDKYEAYEYLLTYSAYAIHKRMSAELQQSFWWIFQAKIPDPKHNYE